MPFAPLRAKQGYTAFGAKTMMQSADRQVHCRFDIEPILLCYSEGSGILPVNRGAKTKFGEEHNIQSIAMFFVYVASIFCVLRGIPVLIESNLFCSGSSGDIAWSRKAYCR